MSRADAMITKVNSLLRKVAPMARKAYKRVYTRTGDTLIGRASVTQNDTLLDPQPFYNRLGRERIPGAHAHAETVVDANSKAVLADDYAVLFSPNAMSLDDLQSKDTVIVLKDTNGNEEVLRLLDFEAPNYAGTDVVYTAYMRSIKQP